MLIDYIHKYDPSLAGGLSLRLLRLVLMFQVGKKGLILCCMAFVKSCVTAFCALHGNNPEWIGFYLSLIEICTFREKLLFSYRTFPFTIEGISRIK